MRKSDKSDGGRKAWGAGQLWLRLPGLVGEALYETVIGVGLACVDEVLEAERAELKEAAARLQEMLLAEGLSEDEIIADFKRWRAGGRK